MSLFDKYSADSTKDLIFIDCEFNEAGGELISMGLVHINGDEFYEVIEMKEEPKEWVAENVMPILNKDPISFDKFQSLLNSWLSQWDRPHIMADYVDDIKHLMEAMITGPGEWFMIQPLTMEVDDKLSARYSKLKHNALADAHALRDSYFTPVDKSKPKPE